MFRGSVKVFLNNFSVILRRYRQLKNLTQNQVANDIGMSVRTYQRIEVGESEPSISQMYKLALILGFKVEEIFHFENEMTEEYRMLWQATDDLRQVTRIARVGVWSFDITTGKAYWSTIVREIFQVDSDFIPIKGSTLKFYQGNGANEIEQAIDECVNFDKSFSLELEIINNKNENLHIIITGMGEKLDNKVVRIFGIIQDITKQKMQNLKIERELSALSDTQFEMGLGRWELNIISGKLIWSDTLFKILEINKDSVNPSYEEYVKYVHPEDRDFVGRSYQESLKNKKPYEIEYRIVMPDGRIKWILKKCKTNFDSNGKPKSSIGFALDITKYKIN